MASYNIGIDTGGTYTDAVLLDSGERRVLASAKALTTRGDLSIGVIESLEKILQTAEHQVQRADIQLVSLSTTLATNALVEGKGSAIAVVLIGFDEVMFQRTDLSSAIPTAQVIRIEGGHKYDGSEQQPLDTAALREALQTLAGQAEAFAVASVYSVRNAAHERAAQAIIHAETGCPVTASCDLSEALNGPRRALTAAFNARIISLIVNLVQAVRTVLEERAINASLMIVKGDGSIASADSVVERPIETILSGPAASVIGANFISGLKDFIISDIGGTTTDVAIVKNGWPDLNTKGAMVGEHRTMVQAIDMQTIGLGGDSEIEISHKGNIILKANRVVPAAMIGARWPSVKIALQRAMSNGMGLGMGTLFILRPTGSANKPLPKDLTPEDRSFVEAVTEEPQPWTSLVNSITGRYRATRLANRGVIQIAGFTPSDAAHVLGYQSQWSIEVAQLVCTMIGRSYGKISFNDKTLQEEREAFAKEVYHAMVAKSAHVLVERLANTVFATDDPLVSVITQGQQQRSDLYIRLTPAIPLVAVGGPAPVFYPEVGRRLGVETVIPQGSEVANAIGAAAGRIKVHASVEITSAEKGGYHLHIDGQVNNETSPTKALEWADTLARQSAEQKAVEAGGEVLEVQVQVERLDIPGMEEDRGLISATVTAECLSRPVGQAG